MNTDSPLAGMATYLAIEDHPVWNEIAPELTPADFDRPYEMDVAFLRWLSRVRRLAAVPFRVTSDARDPEGDTGASKSAHKKRPCRAVDLWAKNNYERSRIVRAAILEGNVRMGVYPTEEDGSGPVHLDCETHPDNPQERLWGRW